MDPMAGSLMAALQEALAGRYVLVRELGRGGMATVYLAHEVALDRPVALKLLPPAAAETSWRERFFREARAAAGLSHANIVPIFAVDQVDGFVFFTMAYVEGETLSQRVERAGPLSVGEVLRVVKEVAQAAQYAHEHGVIHRDLKPDNILLERGSGRAMVMDFGIARVGAEAAADAPEYFEGTIPFLSPERALGVPEDGRSDVYSLGATAYYAATGRLPFAHAKPLEIVRQHVLRPAPPLGVAGQDGDTTLARVVARCLAKAPAERFQTAGELAEAVARAPELSGDVPVALRAFVKRSGHVATLAGGLSVVLLVAVLLLGVRAGDARVAVWALGLIVLVLAAPPLGMVFPLRRVLRAGYGVDHMVAALRADEVRARQELEFELGQGATRRGRTARLIAYMALVVAGVAALWLPGAGTGADVAMGVVLAGVAVALGAGFVGLVRARPRRVSLAGPLWIRFWNSRAGAWTVWVARLGVRDHAERDPLGHVPAVRLMGSEPQHFQAWVEGANTFEPEARADATVRVQREEEEP